MYQRNMLAGDVACNSQESATAPTCPSRSLPRMTDLLLHSMKEFDELYLKVIELQDRLQAQEKSAALRASP